MLRKDLRVGLGIGGVLLAIVIVALVVRSHNKSNNSVAQNTNDDQQVEEGTEPSAASSTDGSGQPLTDTGTGAAAPAPSSPDSAAKPPVDPVFGDPTPAPDAATPPGSGSTAAAGTAGRNQDWEMLLSGRMDASSAGPSVTSVPTPPAGRSTGVVPGGSTGTSLGARTGTDWLAASGPGRAGPTTRSTRIGADTVTGDAPRGGTRTHVVQQGESFASIARSTYGDSRYYFQIIKANPSLNPNALKIGTRVVLPDITNTSSSSGSGSSRATGSRAGTPRSGSSASASRTIDRNTQYMIESGDSLYRISQKLYGNGQHVEDLYNLNQDLIGPDRARLKIGAVIKLPNPPTVASGR